MTYSICFGRYIQNPTSKYRNQIDGIDYRNRNVVMRRMGKTMMMGMMYGMDLTSDGHSLGIL